MIIDKLIQKAFPKSATLRMIAGGAVTALVVSVAVVVVSQLLGHPAHPGLAAAMAVVAASSYMAANRDKQAK
jgi:putative flippase GtrA